MIDSIVVKVTDLRSALQDMRRCGMHYVHVKIHDTYEGSPPCIELSGCRLEDTHWWGEPDYIDAVPENEQIKHDHEISPKTEISTF